MDFILAAAAIVIEEDGYRLATTERIARLAGVSIGTLYQYFSGKADLYSLLLDRAGAAFTKDLCEVVIDPAIGIEANIHRLLEAPRNDLLAKTQVFREFLLYVPGGKEKIDKIVEATALPFKRVIEAYRPDLDPARTLNMSFILTLIIDAIGRHASPEYTEEALIAEFMEIVRIYVVRPS